MNYYISDLHFNHVNVTDEGRNFDNRPFKTVQEMNKILCENWNKVVTPNDTVYVLGDCFWTADNNIYEDFRKLHGNKVLIKGNHCRINPETKSLFQTICDYREMKDTVDGNTYSLVLSHYPIMMWKGQHRGAIHLYGHVHNSHEDMLYNKFLKEMEDYAKSNGNEEKYLAYNVGCMIDYMNYTPRTLKEILEANQTN